MAKHEPLISPKELKSNIIDSSFKDKRHKFYVVYDHLMDHFMIKLVPPEHMASAYHVSDELALLVDPDTKEVVGYQLLEFSSKHLEDFENFKKIWEDGKQREVFGKYQEVEYEPDTNHGDVDKSEDDHYLLGYKPRRISHAVRV